MTHTEIAELRRLHEAATPGPWGRYLTPSEADATFIAALRNALPALLDAAERCAKLEAEADHAE